MSSVMTQLRPFVDRAVATAKQIYYGSDGEPITLGSHRLRYVVGTRPTRLKYLSSPINTVSNDVRQMMYFIDHIAEGNFVVDIGANVGQYSVLFAALTGQSGRVLAFEPSN